MVISPKVAVSAAIYFGLAALACSTRYSCLRIQSAGERTRIASQSLSKSSLQSLTAVKEIKLRRAHRPFVEAMGAQTSRVLMQVSKRPS